LKLQERSKEGRKGEQNGGTPFFAMKYLTYLHEQYTAAAMNPTAELPV
jgi:hypothetical protein